MEGVGEDDVDYLQILRCLHFLRSEGPSSLLQHLIDIIFLSPFGQSP